MRHTAAEALAVMLARRCAYLVTVGEALKDQYPEDKALAGFCTLLRTTAHDVARLATMVRERR